MAESGIKVIGVDLIKDSIEVISNCPNSDSWSLGCDITIDDANAELQEIRVADIILSGNITTGEIAVDIDSQKEVIDLGVSAIVNGINSALTESQIVPYEDILKITTISPEATNETRYASSAFSAKAIYDLITSVGRRVDTLEFTNEQGGVINKEVADRLDKLEKNQFFERYDDQTIKTKYNLFSDHEISAFGLNAGTGGGSGGEGGASYLKDLWDVTIVSAANDDILVYNGTHWVNKPQSSIMPDLSVLNNYLLKTEAAELYLVKDAAKDFASASSVTDLSEALAQLSKTYGNRLNALEKIVQWFHLTQDEQAIYTEKNFYSEKEISAHGLNLGGGSGEGGAIELGNIIGVSLHSPVTGDVFVYNGTHWTNISQSELVPDLSGYATTDSVSTVSNKVKSLEDRLNDLESEKFFFKLEGADDVIYTPYNLFSEKEISAHGLNYGSGSGSSGLLTDLLDVKAENSTSGDLLVFDGTHWINTPQSAIVPSIDTSVIATREWVGQNYASTSDLSNGVKDAKAYTDALRTHVNEQDQILSGQISKILDWFTLEDGVLLTKYNLASEKEVSAKGINASQGGGTSYNRLDSWSAYDSTKAGYVLSALLGYDLHSRVTNLENAEVDLSDYYTKSETNSQIASAIGAIDLSPYATKAALSILQEQHDTLRSEFDALNNLLSSDTTDYINTWNEVVAFLDGYKDESDLATILSGMNADISSRLLASDFESWKTNTFTPLENLVANHTTRLDGVDKTIEDHIAEFIAFRANFEISDDLILVRKNFASTEEVSAKGINQGTGGGGGSSYSRLDTWEGYDNNKAGYVLSAGLGYGLKVAIDELNGYDLDNRVRSIENSYVSKDASGVINGGLVVSSLAIAGGLSSQFLKADGSLDSISYLSTAGGNLYGNLVINGALAVTSNITFYESLTMKSEAGINFYDADNFLRGILLPSSENNYALSWYDTTAWRTIWHSGNFNPSDYLPTNGGTISNGIWAYQLNLNALNTDAGLRFSINGALKGLLRVDSNQDLWYQGASENLLLHSGNIGDYAFRVKTDNAGHVKLNDFNIAGSGTETEGFIDGPLIRFGVYNGYYHQDIIAIRAENVLKTRSVFNGAYSDWKTIAFTDSNVASAQALKTASNVIGATPTEGGGIFLGAERRISSAGTLELEPSNGLVRIGATNRYLEVNSYANNGDGCSLSPRPQYWLGLGADGTNYQLRLTTSGNVLIGTTTDNGAGAKLQVENANNVALSLKCTTYSETSIRYEGSDGKVWTAGKGIMSHGDSFGFYSVTAGRDIVRFTTEGAIINGTLNAGATTLSSLYVSSDIVTESITIGGATLSWENGALKVNTSFYSEKEISAKGLSTGGGSGASYNRLDAWGDYDSSKAGYVLSAYLGDDLNTRLSSLSGVVDTHTSRLSSLENAGYITSSALSGYLPLSGGTIDGRLMIEEDTPYIGFKNTGANNIRAYLGYDRGSTWFVTDVDFVNSYVLLHSGNIRDYALRNDGSNAMQGRLRMNDHAIQWNVNNKTFVLSPEAMWTSDVYELAFYDNSAWHKILHSGNIGSQSVAYATTAGNANTVGGWASSYGSNKPFGTIPVITQGGWMEVGKSFEFHYDNTTGSDYSTALMCTGNYANIVNLPSANGTLALTTDNVASATKLATPRTIWGQSFDGTQDVGGSIYLGSGAVVYNNDATNYYIGCNGTSLATYNMYMGHAFCTVGGTQRMLINHLGNVTIGATDLASSSYRLYVDGTGYFSGAVTANGGLTVNGILTVGGASIHPTANNPYFQLYQNNNYWYWQADNSYTYIGGTMSKALRIDQDGNTLIRGSLGVTGDATMNNATINAVATAKRVVVGTDGMLCNAPATFNDFIYGSSITPRTDNYYVLGNNNYKWYAVTAYNVNVHDAITIEAGKELRFKDDDGVVHTLKYDSTKQAFVFDGNVNATGEMSAKKLNV